MNSPPKATKKKPRHQGVRLISLGRNLDSAILLINYRAKQSLQLAIPQHSPSGVVNMPPSLVRFSAHGQHRRLHQGIFLTFSPNTKCGCRCSNRTRSSHSPAVIRQRQKKAFNDMPIALPIRALISSPMVHPSRNPRSTSGTGLLRILRNPTEWKCAATVALVFFVASLTLALALTRDQKTSEINAKTLKAAAAIKISRRQPLRVQN